MIAGACARRLDGDDVRGPDTATIELNRPQTLNAWNGQFGDDLREALRRVEDDDDVRAVVITGAGRGFSSGADLRDISGSDVTSEGRPDV